MDKKGKLLIIILFIFSSNTYSQELIDNNLIDDEYYNFGGIGGITIFAERIQEFAPESVEVKVLMALNGSLAERKQFIGSDLLEDAGFRRTGNIKFRKTNTSEKTQSVLGSFVRGLTFGFVSPKAVPFSEIEYDGLPRGEFYSFESILVRSKLRNVSLEVSHVMRLEYMLQIEFGNGIIIEDTKRYYTEENINRFEMLILELSEFPLSIKEFKERFINIELPRIRQAFDRYNNPSEDYLRAIHNLNFGNIFRNY